MGKKHFLRRFWMAAAFVMMLTGVSAQQTATVPYFIPDTDSLAWHYIKRAISPKKNVQYGAFSYTTLLGENEGKIYSMLYPVIQQIAAGDRESTIVELDLSSLYEKTTFTASDLGVSTIVSGGRITGAAKNKVSEILNRFDFSSVVHALMNACPYEFYWYDKTKGYSWGAKSYQYNSQEVIINPTFTLSFHVCDEYLGSDEYSVNPQYGKSLTSANNKIAAIINAHKNESDYQKLVSYQKEIHNLVDYNNEAAGNDNTPYGNPWQLIWVFDGDPDTKVVCEGYSKAFQHLCDMSDFNGDVYALCVSGQMVVSTSGRHMWNIVHIDGKNYMVDVTNSDEGSVGNPEYLFLDGYILYQNNTYYYKVHSTNYAGYAYDNNTKSLFTAEQLTMSDTKYVPVERINISNAEISDIQAVVYNGTAQTPSFSVTLNDGLLILFKGTDYTVEYSNNINAGTSAKATVKGKGNYTGTIDKTFTINAKTLVASNVANISAQTYTGSAIEPTVTVTDGTKKLVKGTDYTVTYSNNINAGTSAKATITGKGNYKGTIEKTFTINAKTLVASNIANISSQTYTGLAFEPAVTVTDGSKTLVKGTDYTVTYSNNTNAGTSAKATITGKGNYKGTIEKTFSINAKSLVASNVANISTQTYIGSAIEPEVIVKDGSKTLVKGTDYTVTYSNNINAGTSAKATITGNGNYTGTIEKTFTINAKTLVTSNVANISAQPYTGSAIEPEVTVTDGTKTLVKGTDYTVECSNNINVGTSAKATIIGKGNYKGTVEKTFTINAKTLVASNVANISAQTYTGSAFEPEVTVTDGTKTLVKGTDYTVEYSNNINAGTSAKATVKGKGNYDGTIEKIFTINKAVPSYTTPENLTVKCNQTLADITLPTGFTFDNLNAVLTFGENNVTATFTPSVIENYEVVKNIQLTVTKTDHEYGTPTYSWSDDGKTCTANAVCKNDISHTVSENAIITSEVTTAATCETQGTTTYTATFTTALFETQTKAVQDIAAHGHTQAEAVKENEVAATTEHEGSYDEVVYCSVCHKELSRTTKTTPQLTPEEPGNQDNPEAPGNQDNPEEPGNHDNPEEPDNQDNPEEPGNQDNPEEPGNQDNPEEPGSQDSPEEPGNQDNPEEPGNQDNPEEPGNQDDPDKPSDPETPISEINPQNSVKIWSFEKIVFVANAESEILIADMSGRIVKIVKPENSRMEIRLSNGGIYIVKTGLKTQKIIIR